MKRREFIKGLIAAAVMPIAAVKCFASAVPRKVLTAPRLKKYPGKIVSMGDISGPAKWSG